MSTDVTRLAARSRRTVSGGALAVALGVASVVACQQPVSYHLIDLCRGQPAAALRTLVIDSVLPAAGVALQRHVGRQYDITVSLFVNRLRHPPCELQSGEAAFAGDLPDVLAHAVSSRKQVARWSIQGTSVLVDLNPGVYDNNLSLALPLDGSTGRWSLTSFAGDVAHGRLLARSP